MKISPLGDSALLIDFAGESANPDETLRRVLSATQAIARADIPGVVEITSAFESVALFLEPTAGNDQFLEKKIRDAISTTGQKAPPRHREIEITVCYDRQLALDAERVERETQLTFSKVIELQSSADFTVASLGFMPGYAYLTGLPPELRVPRLPVPRTKVPAGSLAIANAQAGIYPFASPGGWNIIGRTPLPLFDPKKNPPTLFSVGDCVRFRRISLAEFEAAQSSNEK